MVTYWLIKSADACTDAAARASDEGVKRFWLSMARGFLDSFWNSVSNREA